MIDIVNKDNCCGCNACGDICPHKAISFKIDQEGFWYPEVDKSLCVECGLCEKVCPIINIDSLKKNDYDYPSHVFAAYNSDMKIRWDSTSGGAFSALADTMYEKGGYVSGALFNDDFSVRNYISNNPDDLEKLRSSKYVQSNAAGLYAEIKKILRNGNRVLACGTPCQMAGLRAFLGKEYENLIIVDFICRGVNSPKVYRAYLDSLERKYNSKVVYVKAKNKELGWRNLTRKVTFANGESYYGVYMDDDFRRGYHTNVFCRPSCYSCKFKQFPRIADITIADYWGIEKVDKNMDNNVGTSMILLNSKKGESYFNEASSKMIVRETLLDSIFWGNPALIKPIPKETIDRKSFFEDLDNEPFENIADKYFPQPSPTAPSYNGLKGIAARILRTIRPYWRFAKEIRSLYGWNISLYKKFFFINFRKNTQSDWRKRHLIYPTKSSSFDIDPTASITICNKLTYGYEMIKGMHIPSGLRMEANTKLVIKDGPLTRYQSHWYNLRYGAYIEIVNGGTLTIGDGAANVGLTIMCAGKMTIGNGVRIGRNVSIRDWNGIHVILDSGYKNQADVTIENHVWLCTGCTILNGVTIGEGSVVAANATVTKDVPPHSLVAGTPAKVVKENIEWY
ncbi:Coenzyme F420 hydrogenase/dehydrogenase, beta subunit C-terminal domain [Prevotella sp. E9-3]|uniref:Coenzyme F420 hydrogenase/dehydrogenase, beta subunit C-terminal domain n=1 Tax=Prevotella sp. E9-3 TaxID=2913621 RepID=UPI001EDBE7EC|nr:Coenzyme F420 hydrogenase/dehydrogenase, beta subunit C-terminal domain [Prevotella sp. E9-3]UKK47610.1 Coenzyme F420 hydrogenase/dehydrogenase, beta subunit C-terminal domain [Prevotella sp. E9-3]